MRALQQVQGCSSAHSREAAAQGVAIVFKPSPYVQTMSSAGPLASAALPINLVHALPVASQALPTRVLGKRKGFDAEELWEGLSEQERKFLQSTSL